MTGAEMVVVTAVFLIIAASTVVVSNGAAQREEINAVATGLFDWLNVVQRAAQRTTQDCTIRFSDGTAFANGSTLATVTPASCHPQASYLIEEIFAREAGSPSRPPVSRPTPISPSPPVAPSLRPMR